MKKTVFFLLLIMSVLIITGCSEDPNSIQPSSENKGINQLVINPAFNFETSRKVNVSAKVQTPGGAILSGVPVKLYKGSPLSGGTYLATIISDRSGMVNAVINLPTYIDSIYLASDFIGIPGLIPMHIAGNSASYTYNTPYTGSLMKQGVVSSTKYKTLGTWDELGVPDYLEPKRDVIDKTLLDNINTSLPERKPVPQTHPEYLAGTETNLILQDTCEVYVTFVHEGAGFTNVLGYYTYDKNNPPQKVSDIEESMTLILPNASYAGSGGGLLSGDKVKIGNFGKNTAIGWFVLANGFKKGSLITNGQWQFFSHPHLNPESKVSQKQHNVLLSDASNDRVIIGFEDFKREGNDGDEDFNDVLFYVSANPFSAVVLNNIPTLGKGADSDNDGVNDEFDEYKEDPSRAFNNYAPGKDTYGTLSFEDLWPSKGDYDFNDLVVDYNFNLVTNADNKVVEMFADINVKAIGGSFINALGFQLPVPSSAVSSVDGYNLTEGYITLNGNGTEAGNSKAVIFAFDNPFKLFNGGGITLNTIPGVPYFESRPVKLAIKFKTPVDLTELGTAPFNPFIVVNKNRKREVHLKGYDPTDLADRTLFGTGDDRSTAAAGGYYRSSQNLPWAVNFVEPFDYPNEKAEITNAYNFFSKWAETSGTVYKDWYKKNAGYRNEAKIFKK